MSTPTTVKVQIAVPSTDGNGETTEKVYTLTLSLLVEGGQDDGGIKVMLADEESTDEPTLVPPSDVMPPKEPPPPN